MTAPHPVTAAWPAEAEAVPQARRLVRTYLREQGHPELVDDAELLVSELVGNVVLHVGGQVSLTAQLGTGTAGHEVLLQVTDDSPLPPQLRQFSRTSSTGRGMRLVHSLSAEHGVQVREVGKTIWVRLTAATTQRDDEQTRASFADVDWLAESPDLGDACGLADVAGLVGVPPPGLPASPTATAPRRARTARRAAA